MERKKQGWFIDSYEGNIKDSYHFMEKLASGGFGIVYLAEHRKTQNKFAIKAIQKKKVKDYLTFKNEIQILKMLDHPNIIKLHEIWEWNDVCFLVLEYCEGGEVFQYIIQRKFLSEPEVAVIMKQLFSALKYLHESKISHRDLKPENFMLKNKDNVYDIKLIDFGLSKDYSTQKEETMATPSGSPYYIAPEVFQQHYTSKIDLWSMGVVMYILLSGKVPFPGRNELEIIGNVIKGEFHFNHDSFKSVSDECKDLICHLLVKDANQRYSAEDAYNHKWVQKYIKLEEDQKKQTGLPPQIFEDMKEIVPKLRQQMAVLTYLALKLPQKDFKVLKSTFSSMDQKGAGVVNGEEFKRCISKANMKTTSNVIDILIMELDSEKKGVIEYEKFLNQCYLSQMILKEVELYNQFKIYDPSSTGRITLSQLQEILGKDEFQLPEDALARIFKEVVGLDLAQISPATGIEYQKFIETMRKEFKLN